MGCSGAEIVSGVWRPGVACFRRGTISAATRLTEPDDRSVGSALGSDEIVASFAIQRVAEVFLAHRSSADVAVRSAPAIRWHAGCSMTAQCHHDSEHSVPPPLETAGNDPWSPCWRRA